MKVTALATGLLSYVPGVNAAIKRCKPAGAKDAAYCYGVWMKHLALLWEHGMREMPRTVAEMGPGNSLGIGLAALLSGASAYCALDIVEFANVERNLAVFDDLVGLFGNRAPRPSKGWPDYDACLDRDLFPSHILSDERLASSLATERIERIRRALVEAGSDGSEESMVKYVVPWDDPGVIVEHSVDLVVSHAVLEHVSDLGGTYGTLAKWIKPGGWMSHQVDLTSHGTDRRWNGHWTYSERTWRWVKGNRPYLINRQPCSRHVELMEANGFNVTCLLRRERGDGIARSRLAPRWRGMSEEDLACSGMFVQAQKT